MDGYSHPGITEREDVMVRWRGHEGVSRIAREHGRDKSRPYPARSVAMDGKALQGGAAAHRPRRGVRLMRDRHRSPEETSGRIAMARPDLAVSDASIYRAVWSGSLDCELPGYRKASRPLGHHGKRRHGKGSRERGGKARITHDISERPGQASLGSRIGDWEGDTVAGRRLPGHAGGPHERIPCRRQSCQEGQGRSRRGRGEGACQRGRAYGHARQRQGVLGCRGAAGGAGRPCLSLRPPPSLGEGGQRERRRLLRDWFPKGMGIDDVTDDTVQGAYDSLNRRPRKRLNWKCPWEACRHRSLHLL